MDFKKLAPISLICTMVVVGCSFQKDPNKAAPEPVKVGMTKHELEDEILNNAATTFPDRLAYLIKKEDMALATKLISEVSKNKVNEYNGSGETAIEITVRSNLDDLTIQLLRKGASPYLPRKGTNYSPYDYLVGHSGDKRDVLDVIAIADRAFIAQAQYQFTFGVEGLVDFLVHSRFPFYKNVKDEGRLIDQVFNSASEIGHGNSAFTKCQPLKAEELIGLIEKIEGPLTGIDGFKIAQFGSYVRSELMLKRGLQAKSEMSVDERKDILEASMNFWGLGWAPKVFSIVSLNGIEDKDLNAMLIENIQGKSKKWARDAIFNEDIAKFVEKYQDAYMLLYNKAEIGKDVEERKNNKVDINSRTTDEVVNTDLPGGKEIRESPLDERINDSYQKLIDANELYETCIDKE